jgi:flagellar assembly factor FliW
MDQDDALRVATARFGEVTIRRDTVIEFPQGLVGMPQLKRFALLAGSGPFQWLQSLDDPEATFVVIDSDEVVSTYEIHPTEDDVRVVMGTEEPAPLCALLIVTIPREEPDRITANLMAPLIINTERRVGVQAVLPDRYPVRHPIVFSGTAPDGAARDGAVGVG